MDVYSKGLLARMRAALLRSSPMAGLDRWITSETYLGDSKFNFKDHEFQIGILQDERNTVDVRKCSQVGLSELMARFGLAFLATNTGVSVILALPHQKFATKFAKGRLDPIIETSPALASLMVKAADSSDLKRLGTSTLYLTGTYGTQSAISIPAKLLIQDEVDFCNQTVLTQMNSRLRHNLDGGYRRRFSTPTVPGYGIDLLFTASTQAHYLCRCKHCNHEDEVDFETQVVIPGWEGSFEQLEREHISAGLVDYRNAWIRCLKCGKDLQASLQDPSCRRWVEKCPGREHGGYQVAPTDLPLYNTPARILAQLQDYERKADFYNFVLGLPYEDAENSILGAVVDAMTTLPKLDIEVPLTADNVGIGVDVGKTAHILIGTQDEGGKNVVWAETYRYSAQDTIAGRVCELIDRTSADCTVIDAGPDFSTASAVVAEFPGRAFANYYVRTEKRNLSITEINEETGTLSTNRTKSLDRLVKGINGGHWRFARMEEMRLVKEHFRGMKRVTVPDQDGEPSPSWMKTGEDHFFHAANYLDIAFEMSGWKPKGYVFPAPATFSGVQVGADHLEEERDRGWYEAWKRGSGSR